MAAGVKYHLSFCFFADLFARKEKKGYNNIKDTFAFFWGVWKRSRISDWGEWWDWVTPRVVSGGFLGESWKVWRMNWGEEITMKWFGNISLKFLFLKVWLTWKYSAPPIWEYFKLKSFTRWQFIFFCFLSITKNPLESLEIKINSILVKIYQCHLKHQANFLKFYCYDRKRFFCSKLTVCCHKKSRKEFQNQRNLLKSEQSNFSQSACNSRQLWSHLLLTSFKKFFSPKNLREAPKISRFVSQKRWLINIIHDFAFFSAFIYDFHRYLRRWLC